MRCTIPTYAIVPRTSTGTIFSTGLPIVGDLWRQPVYRRLWHLLEQLQALSPMCSQAKLSPGTNQYTPEERRPKHFHDIEDFQTYLICGEFDADARDAKADKPGS